jgi:hypothetical protein
MIPLISAILVPSAGAFCGAYVGGVDETPTNQQSTIVLARTGEHTILTLYSDSQGADADFGLLIPVPSDVDADDLRLVERAALDRLDAYTAPRLVAYSCEDFYSPDVDPNIATQKDHHQGSSTTSSSSGCGSSGGGSSSWTPVDSDPWWEPDDADTGAVDSDPPSWVDTGTGVIVEEEFDLEEYTAAVLTAPDAAGLQVWLDENGFSAPDETTLLLQEYINQGSSWLALRVNADIAGEWPSPLQLHYESERVSLPLRLGTSASQGLQELVLYVLADGGARYGISNYDEAPEPQSECMLHDTSWYLDAIEETTGLPDNPAEALERQVSGLAWTTEYSWAGGKCDPCPTGGPLTSEDARSFGLTAVWTVPHVTRLRLRYTPDAVPMDPVFYDTGVTDPLQRRYVTHKWELETLLPTCGHEPDEPGDCYTAEYWARVNQGSIDAGDSQPDVKSCGASAGATRWLSALLFLPLLALWRRR